MVSLTRNGAKHWLLSNNRDYGWHDWTCCDHPNRYYVCVKDASSGTPIHVAKPIVKPTAKPSANPTANPTAYRTASPTANPTANPAAPNPPLPTSSVRAPWTTTPLQSPKNDPPLCRNPFISDPESWDCACHEKMVKTCPSKDSFDAGCYLSLLCANSKVCPSWKAQVCCSDHDEHVKKDTNGAAENCAGVANNCEHAIVRLNCPRTCGLCTLPDRQEADIELEDALAGEQAAQSPWVKDPWANVKLSKKSTVSPSRRPPVSRSVSSKDTC